MSKEVDRRVEAIGRGYQNTVATIENRAHVCTPDPTSKMGRCLYCLKVVELAPNGRTGELWTSEK